MKQRGHAGYVTTQTLFRIARRLSRQDLVEQLTAEFPWIAETERLLEAAGCKPGAEITGSLALRTCPFDDPKSGEPGDREFASKHIRLEQIHVSGVDGDGRELSYYSVDRSWSVVGKWAWIPTFDQFCLTHVGIRKGEKDPELFDVAREIVYTPSAARERLIDVTIA